MIYTMIEMSRILSKTEQGVVRPENAHNLDNKNKIHTLGRYRSLL